MNSQNGEEMGRGRMNESPGESPEIFRQIAKEKEREGEMAHQKSKKSQWEAQTHKKHCGEFVGIPKKGRQGFTKSFGRNFRTVSG
jgi:hypothetical protein